VLLLCGLTVDVVEADPFDLRDLTRLLPSTSVTRVTRAINAKVMRIRVCIIMDLIGGAGDGSGGGKGGKAGAKGSGLDIADNGLPNGGKLSAAGGALGNIIGTGSQTIKKGSLSGLARALDDRMIQIDNWGNPYGGMPEDVLGHFKFCAQFVYSGLYSLAYLTIRYPLKILTKAIYLTGAVGFIASYAMWCINPLVMIDFTNNGKKANSHLERFGQFRDELKKRIIYTADKARHEDRQMYGCCAWHDYKRKIYEEAPEVLRFAQFYHKGMYKLPEIVYCMKYQEGSQACDETDLTPTNEEPERMLPQSFYITYLDLFDKFL